MLRKLRPYWQALPDIFSYQLLTKPLIGFWIYLCSSADGLITDNVTQAVEMEKRLRKRSDLQRMIDRIMTIVS